MRAHILQRVEAAVDIEDANLAPRYTYDLPPAGRDIFSPRDNMPGHQFLHLEQQEFAHDSQKAADFTKAAARTFLAPSK
jgi:hypothetical protein